MKILIKRSDGGLSILNHISTELTVEENVAKWQTTFPEATAVEWREISDNDLPASREFRNAWVDATPESKIDVCCEKAKHIAMEHLRQRRNEALAKTDIELTRAVEESQDLAPVREKRNALRDATEGLKAIPTAGVLNDEATLEAIRTERDKPL